MAATPWMYGDVALQDLNLWETWRYGDVAQNNWKLDYIEPGGTKMSRWKTWRYSRGIAIVELGILY